MNRATSAGTRISRGALLPVVAAVALLAASFASCAATRDVTAYGARPDGATDSTAAIQRAIDECSASGGGRVLVPGGGVYKTYTLSLKSGVELHIDRGATLKGGENPYKYPEFGPTDVWNVERAPRFNRRAMFYTAGQTNVAITGSGTIDGNAEAFHERVDGRWRRISDTNITGRCVFFVGCRDVRLDDVLIYHPCGWSTWFLDCDRVQCRRVRVECDHEFHNGDGLHFGGCRDVTVSDCIIDAEDDALIVRTHQEQMRKARPCERMTFANCVLRSNQCAIRIGWTGDGPIRDVSFDNIQCAYSRLGVQFYLPAEPMPPAEWNDPPRGRGLAKPPLSARLPFSVENMRFSNMSVYSFNAPFSIDVGRTERVACLKDISFSHCRFTAQQPPVFRCRPEDMVSGWRFSDVTFEIAKPRGQSRSDVGMADGASLGWFENVRDVTLDNVRWSWFPQDRPEWSLVLEQEGSSRPVRLNGARMDCEVDDSSAGVRRFRYDAVTDGYQSWNVKVELEERTTAGGRTYTGRIVNNDKGITVTSFEGPYFDRVRVDPQDAALYVPCGLGHRERHFPCRKDRDVKPLPPRWEGPDAWRQPEWHSLPDGRFLYDTCFYPSVGATMPWLALCTEGRTLYAGVHDAKARPKKMRLRWNPDENRADISFEHRMFLPSGEVFDIPETVFDAFDGDWHAAAKRYRRWYDSARQVRVASPDWTRDVTGWLLVIMKQQNEELMWPYTDIPRLCDVAERNGLDCIGLFGWTVGGHDHLYPDYDPDPKMGGVEALKAGIAEAHRRGIRVCIYANGQLQQVGATRFWDECGESLALVTRDGSPVIQTYHKYADIPEYKFALGCLYGRQWFDRMYSLAEQAEGFGADAILYDQLGVFAPFACYGKGHGHQVPYFSYSEERPAFIRRIADGIQRRNPGFAILTEGLHDTVLDSIGFFHGCEYGNFSYNAGRHIPARAKGEMTGSFPEMWAYSFPELVTTMRFNSPMLSRTMANLAAVFGFRHNIEVRYMPDRAYVLDGVVPTKSDYGTVKNLPDLEEMAKASPHEVQAYAKSVCDFQRANAKYLLRGRFVDDEGFVCPSPALTAKRFVAADGTSAVCVWNMSDEQVDVVLSGLGEAMHVLAPDGTSAQGAMSANSLRLYVFQR